MKKVLVTGGAGYVGSVLCGELLKSGYEVLVVDNFFKGSCDALLPYCENPNFSFLNGDVTNESFVSKIVDGVDAVVHLAALVGYPICSAMPKLAEIVNVQGTKNIVQSLRPEQRLVFASTGSVYGAVENTCDENTPLNTNTVYGLTKAAAEKVVAVKKNSISLRFATGFGLSPNMRVNLLVNDFVFKAFTQGYLAVYESFARRTFIHVRDMARAFIWALEPRQHQVYNCGDNNLNWTKRAMAEFVKEHTGCSVFYEDFGKDADNRDYEVDYSRINNEGFQCSISMEDGIKELIKATPLMRIRHQYE